MAVAINPNTPSDVLGQMAKETSPDSESGIYRAIIENPNTPTDVLEWAAQDEWHVYRRSAAQNPSTPVDVLRRLAGDSSTSVWAAANPSTPVDVLTAFATDGSDLERGAVARNPSLPGEALTGMNRDADPTVAYRVAAAETRRIREMFDLHESNTAAIDLLRGQEWWAMTPGSPAVVLAKTLFPNA